MPQSSPLSIVGLASIIAGLLVAALSATAEESAPPARRDLAAWGGDHVGQPFPAYMTGDECLFCHREIGQTWPGNRHQLTIRPSTVEDEAIATLRQHPQGKDIVVETQYLMGSRRMTRFLRRSGDYGKLEMLSTSFVPKGAAIAEPQTNPRQTSDDLRDGDSPRWDKSTFGDRCAGCHATAVDVRTRAFSALSLDCFTCHGDVSLEHTADVSRVLLSKQNAEPRQIVSLCGQCHLRGGQSKSSGLPYPNTFVAGDNLFRDFQVDFSDAAVARLPAIDRHVYLSARDVAASGESKVHCLACHNVHGQSTEKHQALESAAICTTCHVAGTDNSRLLDALHPSKRRGAHSRVCDY